MCLEDAMVRPSTGHKPMLGLCCSENLGEGLSVYEKAGQQKSTHLKPSVDAAQGLRHQLTSFCNVHKVDAAL